ncbi:ATP-binding cassette long-chain fatty acid transporter pxa2, partial [Linderina macrospora]
MVITSKPYVKPGGSMWEQVIFPHIKSQSLKRNVTEHHLTGLVQALGLERELFLDLCDHDWGRVSDWTKILKPHGMLALAIARTMYLQPKYALVDDDALQMLAAEQVRRLVEVAGHHHVTLLISAATMPTATTSAPGYLPAMAQIARVLEISCSEWRFAA